MSTITREQIEQYANAARLIQVSDFDKGKLITVTPDHMLELARIALASLEAQAVAYVDPFAFHNFSVYRAGETDNRRMGREWMWANPDAGLIPVYTTPPAPVSVPKDIPDSVYEVLCQACGGGEKACDFADELWAACRAAMLQGADGNSPVIPDGYCIMPLKLTADNGAKSALCGEFHVQYRIVCQSCVGEGCEDCNHAGGWEAEIPVSWDTIKRIHEAAVEACALPAALQQEVKP